MIRCFKKPYLLFFMFFNQMVLANVPFVDTGKLLTDWQYEAAIHMQMLSYKELTMMGTFSAITDVNMFATWDEGLSSREDINMKYYAAGGSSGFQMGSFVKWIPFPDYKYQPAVGFSGGGGYQLENLSSHYLKLYIRPLISKSFIVAQSEFIPYVSLPLAVHIRNFAKVYFPINIVVGFKGELFFIPFRKFHLILECSFELFQSDYSYISLGVSTQLNRSNFE